MLNLQRVCSWFAPAFGLISEIWGGDFSCEFYELFFDLASELCTVRSGPVADALPL